VHRTTIHVRWGELDAYQHVNHATYLSYLEHARVATLESVGWGMHALTAAGYQVVVVRIDIRFRRPPGRRHPHHRLGGGGYRRLGEHLASGDPPR
jgi:acyl-CoA thioesterase FadM